MRTLIYIAVAFLITSCGSASEETTAEDEKAITTIQQDQTERDSISLLYHQYYSELQDTFPRQCVPEVGKINPMDAAPLDTSFFVFRETLKRLVEQKDIFGLLPHIDENIKVSFGAESGMKTFITNWELDAPEKIPHSNLWPVLEDLLSLGGDFHSATLFEAPYLNPCWPHDKDSYTYGAIIGAGVRLRADPSVTSPIVATLSYDVVEHLKTTEQKDIIGAKEYPWIKVKTANDKVGYVYGRFFRLPIDFRAVFERNENGHWKMITLVAGD